MRALGSRVFFRFETKACTPRAIAASKRVELVLRSLSSAEHAPRNSPTDQHGGGSSNEQDNPKMIIMEHALNHVNRRGWTDDALAAGAVDAGYPPVTHGLFDRGPVELAEYFLDQGNERLQKFLDEELEKVEQGMKGEELVVAALVCRLEHTVPYLRSWPQAMALGLYPNNLTTTTQKLHGIPDKICAAADQSEGGGEEWEKRKGAIGAIFAASELFMLTDYSEGYSDTRNFVKKRLQDALKFEGKAGPTADTLGAAAGGIASIISAAADLVAPLMPKVPVAGPLSPPNPQEVISKMRNGAQQITMKAEDIAKSPNPLMSTLQSFQHIMGQQQQQRQTGSPTRPESKSHENSPENGKFMDDAEFEELGFSENRSPLAPVKLPSNMSLFGLMSMSGEEAAALVRESNPDFKVLVTDVDDEKTEPLMEEKVVRLLVNKDNVVVDVLRS